MSPSVCRLRAILELRIVWAAIFVVFFSYLSVRFGTDGTPDFRIYHYYNGYAALFDRTNLDLVPAQLQTFLFPYLDAVYYLLFRGLNSHPTLLNIILSLPYAFAGWVVFFIGDFVVPRDWPWRRTATGLAALYGTTGAGGLPTLATTMSDVVPGVLALAALLFWLRFEQQGKNENSAAALTGAVCGLSVALKLTIAPLFIALGLVIFLRRLKRPPQAIKAIACYGVAGSAVFLAAVGPWLLHNYIAYGNPFFPAFNDVFKSDFVSHSSWLDTRFKPKTILMALFYPAYWAFTPSHDAIELNMQDPRILFGLISAGMMLVVALVGRNSNKFKSTGSAGIPCWYLALYFVVGYVLWELRFSIFRYLATLECLSGVMVLGALRACWGYRSKSRAIGVFCAIIAASATVTRYPWWSRAMPAAQAIQIRLPEIERDAMIIFLDPYAYSYLVPSMPETVRVIGANNNIVRPGVWGELQAQVAHAISDYRGSIWGVDDPREFPGVADQTLAYYHLSRSDNCAFVETNIEDRPNKIRMCHLVHQ